MSEQISGILIAQSLKNVENGLTQQEKALATQNVMLFGADGLPNGKSHLDTKAVIDVKSGKPLSEMLEYITPVTDSDLYVDMGLPSGLLWAKKNMDASQSDGFAASEYQYECSFVSWGNVESHNPISQSAFDYNWGSDNDGSYASTPGAGIVYPAGAGPSFDAARKHCGAPWRLPTTEEFKELFDNCDFVDENGNVIAAATTNKLITLNSIVGIRLKSKINGRLLFFPCSGHGYGTSWIGRGAYGYYWSSSLYSATGGRGLSFYSGGVYPQYGNSRFFGFAVRPVQ